MFDKDTTELFNELKKDSDVEKFLSIKVYLALLETSPLQYKNLLTDFIVNELNTSIRLQNIDTGV